VPLDRDHLAAAGRRRSISSSGTESPSRLLASQRLCWAQVFGIHGIALGGILGSPSVRIRLGTQPGSLDTLFSKVLLVGHAC